jgi:hypothetical protein
MRSGRVRAGPDDRPDMLATQRGGEPSRHEPVHDLHALDVARVCHDLDERTVDRQRALELCKVGSARLAEQLRLLSAGAFGVGGIHPIDVLHDREAGRSERVGEQKRARVGPVRRDTRARELVVVIGRKGTPDNGAGRGEVIASWLAMVGCST